MRRRIGSVEREDRALATLMAACTLIFVAQWPRLSREAFQNVETTLEALMAGALFGWLVIAPLAMYGIAFSVFLLMRLLRSSVSAYESRMSLFWALLAAAPLWLLTGLMSGFSGATTGTRVIGALALGAFLVFWGLGLKEMASQTRVEAQ